MCCNRPPEVELSEAAALADDFVFRLMFRLYLLPQSAADYREVAETPAASRHVFYERKRLMSAFAARKSPFNLRTDGKRIPHTKYLMISALALDTRSGACSALTPQGCCIYDRRPLSCRAVPFHYSHPEALAVSNFDGFVQTPGYECDTSDAAPPVLAHGRIVAADFAGVRSEAIAVAGRDRAWSEAIVRRMAGPPSPNLPLPSIQDVEDNAAFGVLTTPMSTAWRIAADKGFIGSETFDELIARQLELIGRELAEGRSSEATRNTLFEMREDYRAQLAQGFAPLASGTGT
jgi:Fe-S-cluster containining protein